MGASVSGAHGHSSHPEHNARFNRVDRSNSPPSPCRMCKLTVELGAPAYRCSEPGGCAVVLHDACYHRPTTLKRHFGHPKHHLVLGAADTRAAACSICAKPLGTPAVAYSCDHGGSGCAGFSAHPRCCDLIKRMTAPPKLHEHTKLVLRAPGGNGGDGGEGRPRRRKCLRCERTGKSTGPKAPWSYQCTEPGPNCAGVEYCLACVLGNNNGGGRDDAVRCWGCLPCGGDVDTADVHCGGYFAGVFFRGFLSGMGCLGIPTQLHPRDMELPPRHRN